MAFQARIYQILICSPSDVQEERNVIGEVIHAVNALHAFDMKTVLLPVRWETHTSPKMGDRPQAIINKQIVEDCDILVAVFWTRIGTPTGVAESGSVEEIREFMSKGKPVLLYFSDAPVALNSVDPDQYKSLTDFKNDCKQKGLIETYSDISEFQSKLHPHLLRTVRSMPQDTRIIPLEKTQSKLHSPDNKQTTLPNTAHTPPPEMSLRSIVNATAFENDLDRFVREYEIEWSAERDSEPINTDEAKLILRKADRKLLSLRAHPLVYEHPEIASRLDELLRAARTLQRHRLFLDGGKSFRDFWDLGNNILQNLKSLAEIASKMTMPPAPQKTKLGNFKEWIGSKIEHLKKIRADIGSNNRAAQIELTREWLKQTAKGIETGLGGQDRNKFVNFKPFAAQAMYGEAMGGLEGYIDTYISYLQHLLEDLTSNKLLSTFDVADLE